MTTIDFYILPDDQFEARARLACRLTDKAYTKGHRIHLHSASSELTHQLDDLLWTFRDRSFIPHEVEPETGAITPVTLGHGWTPETCEVLINLADDVPVFFSRFERVAEIVNQDSEVRESGRLRYRFYRDRGYALAHHQL